MMSSSLADPKLSKGKIAAKTFSAKFRSKREVWNFLTVSQYDSYHVLTGSYVFILFTQVDVGAYLCPYENVTIYHMRDLVSGKKKFIKADAVKVLHVPQYNTLTIKKILEKAKLVPEIKEKLPEKDAETFKMPKSYICNLCYTVIGNDFKNYVQEMINLRNGKLPKKVTLTSMLIMRSYKLLTSPMLYLYKY